MPKRIPLTEEEKEAVELCMYCKIKPVMHSVVGRYSLNCPKSGKWDCMGTDTLGTKEAAFESWNKQNKG